MDEPTALAAEIRRSLVGRLVVVAFTLVFVPFTILGAIHRNTLDQDGDVREVPGRLVARETLGDCERLVTEFTTHAGAVRRTNDSASWYPDARVGDTLPVIYSAEPGSDFARLAEPVMDRLFLWTFVGATAVFVLLAALHLVTGLAHFRCRRDLAARGVRIAGQRVRLEHRPIPFMQGQRQWCVRASWLDERTVEWRGVSSEWQSGDPPADSLRAPPTILIDPQDGRRAWLPAALLRF